MKPRMVGPWDRHYAGMRERLHYGAASYVTIAEFMAGCPLVEDRGCGGGALAEYLVPGTEYRGVDGSATPFANVHDDLRTYRSDAPGVVLRHVLEHNDEWEAVLDSALASFTDRLCVVLFTPLVDATRVMFREPDYHDVPVIAFRLVDLLDRMRPLEVEVETVVSPDTAFGTETFITAYR